MTETDKSGESETRTFRCPYPDCDWETSRPVDSDNGLTQAVVEGEVEKHRYEHSGGTYGPLEGVSDGE